jgi:MerR family mercuric resistance operon transcriptional regulator
MTVENAFSIGQVSAQSGCNIETIRYYERIGMVPKPPRSSGKQRIYNQEHLRILTFVRRSRELGFHLSEIRTLLDLSAGREDNCEEVKSIAEQHLTEIRGKIADLSRMENILSETVKQCTINNLSDCPILETINGSGAQEHYES